jgi:ankyrin repeat protein
VEIIKILLDKGMSVDMTNADDSIPLHFSAKNGNLEATKALVERGAALNNANRNGASPMHLVAKHGKLEVFLYLKEIDANTDIYNVQ